MHIAHENGTEGYIFSEYEEEVNTLDGQFRNCQHEYGRCTGKVYIDRTDGEIWPIGWVFESRESYADRSYPNNKETYLRRTWVSFSTVERNALKIGD